MKFIHHDIIVEIRGRFLREGLRIEGLNGDEEGVQTVRPVAPNKQLSKIRVL